MPTYMMHLSKIERIQINNAHVGLSICFVYIFCYALALEGSSLVSDHPFLLGTKNRVHLPD